MYLQECLKVMVKENSIIADRLLGFREEFWQHIKQYEKKVGLAFVADACQDLADDSINKDLVLAALDDKFTKREDLYPVIPTTEDVS